MSDPIEVIATAVDEIPMPTSVFVGIVLNGNYPYAVCTCYNREEAIIAMHSPSVIHHGGIRLLLAEIPIPAIEGESHD